MTRTQSQTIGRLLVTPFPHPQGCRSWVVTDPTSGQSLAVDPHLDLIQTIAEFVREEGWSLPYVLDTHTHADHPSGSAALAARFSATRLAHPAAAHAGVLRHPADGETLHLGDELLTVRHAPGHTPDHVVLIADGALFSGDTLLIGAVARTDFLGGDAGQLFDSLRALLSALPDDTSLFPGHDYQGRLMSTLADEKRDNAWLQITDREAFVKALTANPPPRPANMDDLLRLNKEGVEIPASVSAAEAVKLSLAGGATSIIDVRTGMEFESESVPGSRHVPLDEIVERADELRAVAAPRLLLCRAGSRAEAAKEKLETLGIGGLSVVEGGLEAFRSAGGDTLRGRRRMSLERQVRVVAGALVVATTALGFFLHESFLLLAGFVGAGLVFAGLTDRCGMALLLAKLPWNRTAGQTSDVQAGGGCAANLPPAGGGCAANLPPTD